MELRPYQIEALQAITEAESRDVRRQLVVLPTGCLAADTVIQYHRAGVTRKMTIEKLAYKSAGGGVNTKVWDPTIPTMVRREVGFQIRLGEMKSCFFSGSKETYTLTTDSYSIRATATHPFQVPGGWTNLGDLQVGDSVCVEGKKGQGRQVKKSYRVVNYLHAHPYCGRKGVDPSKGGHSVPYHRLVAEAALNGLKTDLFVKMVKDADVEGLEFLDPAIYAVHHRDENHRNNELINLEVMTHQAHETHHGTKNAQNCAINVVTEEIRSIEYYGVEDTYDIEMADDPHNFVAQGFVVHNSGKTVIFTNLETERADSYPMLIIAHREELLDQAADKLRASNGKLKVGKEQATHEADMDCDVVVASVPTLGRSGSSRIEKWSPHHFKTVVVDEAHHAAASTYQNVLGYFRPQLLLGVTATPQRGDNVKLSDTFDEVVYYKTIMDLIEEGWLSTLVGYRVDTNTDISGVSSNAGDYVVEELVKAIDTPERNALAVKAYNDLTPDEPCLCFAASISHAEGLVSAFREANVTADLVVGTTVRDVRADLFRQLREGELRVLVNVGVLTEGFDEPSVSSILLARPTRSHLLYTQIVGRGTRLHHGKSHCTVIDLADVTKGKKPVGLPSLVGLAPDFDLNGNDIVFAEKKVAELADRSPESAARVRSFADIDVEYKLIDIFRPPKPSEIVQEHSALIWTEITESSFVIGMGPEAKLSIREDALGRWQLMLAVGDLANQLGDSDSLREAFTQADSYILAHYPDTAKLLDSRAAWRSDGPTDKQVKFLRRIGVPITTDLTKGGASMIIDKWMKENPRSFAQQKAIEASKRKRLSGGW